jgi:hypothetical protein
MWRLKWSGNVYHWRQGDQRNERPNAGPVICVFIEETHCAGRLSVSRRQARCQVFNK